MQLLNVGCGGNRPGPPWKNIDTLRSTLAIGTPERAQLDKEENYVDFDISFGLPFPGDAFDGLLISHVLEHFDCHGAATVLESCYRVLKKDGLLVASVPDADYFLSVHDDDTTDRAVELFGEPICPTETHDSFFSYALFNQWHKQVLTKGSLECLLRKGGFDQFWTMNSRYMRWKREEDERMIAIESIMNRRKFSVETVAVK